ncbi:Small, acid-soluble spore protein D [Mycobacteroides abscessus subsp. abscessus]|jgi:small acid-soluble spore protein A (major alpha-type SASP)|nr:Small, acid-soluble spore protein D [Mycobacteroides abscessus subsp. abscessus]
MNHAQNLCWEWIALSRNKLLVPGSENALNQMKEEIANEFGVQLGADTTARANGSVGGEMTKRLIQMAEQQLRS